MAAMTLLLVISLFLAVRRLKSFMLFVPGSITEAAVDLPARPPGTEVDALMRDAILRLELAPTASSAEGGEGAGGRTTIDALEKALSSHEQAEEPEARGASRGLSRAMATLSELYSRADGLTIKSTIDQSAKVTDARNSFLLLRSAEWVLEAITLRKRAGEVTLQLSASGHDVVLRIHALVDNSNLPIVLAPRESEQANVLQQGVLARGGSFIVAMGPTGFSLTLTLPIDS